MTSKRRPRVMLHFFPLPRLKKLNAEGTPPPWAPCHGFDPYEREYLCLEYRRPDGTGDFGGIHFGPVAGSRDTDRDLALLAAGRNALPHFIAVIEAAFALESQLQGSPALCDLSRALDVFRERRTKRRGSLGRSDMNAEDPSVSREVVGAALEPAS
jgi:hypothetical protein